MFFEIIIENQVLDFIGLDYRIYFDQISKTL